MKKRALALEIISGILFLISGFFLLTGTVIPTIIDPRLLISLLLILSGSVIVVCSIYGVRIGSAIILIISLCIFTLILFSPSLYSYIGKHYEATYSLSISDINTSINKLIILAKSSTGGIYIDFIDNETLLYRVKFRGWFFFIFNLTKPSIEYEVSDHTLYLVIDSKMISANILLPKKYILELSIESSTGAVKISGSDINISKLNIDASTGRINIDIEKSNVDALEARTSTGKISVKLIDIEPVTRPGEIILSTSTGSIDMELKNVEGIDLRATTSMGKIDVKAPEKYYVDIGRGMAIVKSEPITYIITLSTSTGKISVDVE